MKSGQASISIHTLPRSSSIPFYAHLYTYNMTDYKFEGWLGDSPESVKGQMKWGEFEPKTWTEDDVDIKITHCGICGSDLHTLRSGWGATDYPCCVGHEIVGTVVRVGKNVKQHKLGDRVGVGAQARSCMQPDCPDCSVGQESYCKIANINTYGARFPEGGKSYGGYADYHRANQHFTIKIPEGLPSEHAAPLMCGGITVYSPLKNHGAGPGKAVGIVGVGGLGHFGVLFAKALGADKVVGISRRASKRDEVLKLGADAYIATADEEDWAKKHALSLDLIVSTVSSPKMPLAEYMGLLKTGGTFVQVGAPDNGELPPINAFTLLASAVKVTGSAIGPPAQIKEMLDLCVEKKIVPWVETRPLSEANKAVVDMEEGKARYRYVLVNEKHL
ncbi:chaperonin 10-like protein [Aspergillus karnatakaensis]|uniref:NAD(P)-dependent alcohol dehydrogenase n=1 Tax=Aspergillus karnatakaensis TaxID=1810916 RepID=UPI003CCCFDE1